MPSRQYIFTCPSGCGSEGSSPSIWGTKMYTWDSVVCRAAIHDYRMLPTDSGMNITIDTNSTDFQKYLPTIQRGISSKKYGALGTNKGYFRFTTPYITEDLLDVATINQNSKYTDAFSQGCFQSDTDMPITFQYYIPLSQKTDTSSSGAANPASMTWQNSNLKPGGYWCNVAKSTYSNVMSLAMATDADFQNDQWTLTKSIQQTAVIHFTPSQPPIGSIDVTWKKDRQTLYSFPNMVLSNNDTGYYLVIDDLQIGDGGIYSLEINGRMDKQAIMRLIVRRCQDNMFGSNCDQQCPICQNGGVCHDVMGTCICAPGYSGTNCANSCPTNFVGQNCAFDCKAYTAYPSTPCKGSVICLPDPFGCSCAIGYTGPNCDQAEPQNACQSDDDCASDQSCQTTDQGMKDCAPVCSSTSCGLNADCMTAVPHTVTCQCISGFTGDANTGCQPEPQNACQSDDDCASDQSCQATDQGMKDCAPVCMSTSCGPNANCVGASHTANCQCNPGYMGNANDVNTGCQQAPQDACQLDTDCTSDQSCLTTDEGIKDCVAVCMSTTCGPNANCIVDSHTAICKCRPGFTGNAYDVTTGCQANSGGGSTDCGPTVDRALQNAVQSNSFNYMIPTVNLGSSTTNLSMVRIFNLKNLRRTGNCTMTINQQGGYSIDETTIGATNILIIGFLSKLFVRMNIQSFNSMLKIKIPTNSNPMLLGYRPFRLDGVQVTISGGPANVNQLLNLLITVAQRLVPAFFVGIINFILYSMFANLVQNLSL